MMTRIVTVGAAQMGPIARDESRELVVERLRRLHAEAVAVGCDVVVFPELALTTFFPRWYTPDLDGHDSYFETSMPNDVVQPLFDDAARTGCGFCLGYAELTPDGHRYNTYVLVDGTGAIVGRYRKVHIPGHADHQPERPFQHLERRYFEESPDGFGVVDAFGGSVGMAICNDRRWPETYRVLGLLGAEMVFIGYNTPLYYAPDPDQNPLQSFHNNLVMAAGAYQNGMFVVGVAKGGIEEGVESLSHSQIIAPSGQVIAQATVSGDLVISARCDLDLCRHYTDTLFDFSTYRRPEVYGPIVESRGVQRR
jgi:predicted amidohydrolase